MVRVAGASFEMGAAALRAEEGPPRQVRVGAFWIDRTEVTNAAFARFVAEQSAIAQAIGRRIGGK